MKNRKIDDTGSPSFFSFSSAGFRTASQAPVSVDRAGPKLTFMFATCCGEVIGFYAGEMPNLYVLNLTVSPKLFVSHTHKTLVEGGRP